MSELLVILFMLAFCGLCWALVPLSRAVIRWMEGNTARQRTYLQAATEAVRERHAVELDTTRAHRIIERVRTARRSRGVPNLAHNHASSGFVYVMCINQEYYKIGLTTDVQSRYSQLRTATPYPLEVVHIILTECMEPLEAYLHRKYADRWVQGEWFKLTPDDIAELCAIQSVVTLDMVRAWGGIPTSNDTGRPAERSRPGRR